MVFRRGVFLLHFCLTYTPTTNPEVKTLHISSMQMILVLEPRMQTVVEERLSTALEELIPYYADNHLRANPSKTQLCAFHLRNKETKRKLKVLHWSGTLLENCDYPVYLGLTLDRCLSFKNHIQKANMKVGSRNNILSKLTGTRVRVHILWSQLHWPYAIQQQSMQALYGKDHRMPIRWIQPLMLCAA